MRAVGLILAMSVLLASNFHYVSGSSEEEILARVEKSLDNIIESLKSIENQANPTTTEPTTANYTDLPDILDDYAEIFVDQSIGEIYQIMVNENDVAEDTKAVYEKKHKIEVPCLQCLELEKAFDEVDRITNEIAAGTINEKQADDMEIQEDIISDIEDDPSDDLLEYVEDDDEFSQKIENVISSKEIVTKAKEEAHSKETAIIVVSVVGSLFFLAIVGLTVALVMTTKKNKKLKKPKPDMKTNDSLKGQHSPLKDGSEIGSTNEAFVKDMENNNYPPTRTNTRSVQNAEGQMYPDQRPIDGANLDIRMDSRKQTDQMKQNRNSYKNDTERMQRSSQFRSSPSAYTRDERSYPIPPRPMPRANSRPREQQEMRPYNDMGRKSRSQYDPPKPFNYTSPPTQSRPQSQYGIGSQPGPSRSRNDLRRPYGPEDLY